MNRILNTAMFTIAALLFSMLGSGEAVAQHEITLNLVSPSNITLTGAFSGAPFATQDGQSGTTDGAATASNFTTFSGTISVRVSGPLHNVNSPSSIQIINVAHPGRPNGDRFSNADAAPSGTWLPEVYPLEDLNLNGTPGEFGLPPEGDSRTATSNDRFPAAPADWGVRVPNPGFPAVSLAWAAARDISYDITMPGAVPVVAGSFSSLTENFEFGDGAALDYWVDPAVGNLRGRADLDGGDDDNAADTVPSTYLVTMLPGNQRQITLTVPVNVDAPGGDADFFYTGVLTATLTVPEPSSFLLLGFGTMLATFVGRRSRK
jgi:hypothetical protein